MNETERQRLNGSHPAEPPTPPEISGKWVILGVFGFAVLMTGGMWLYWRLHVGPFLPLQRAIVAEWPDSAPLVQGGQRKMHQGTPRILRATLKVPFDPVDEDRTAELEARVRRVRELAAETLDLATYDFLEVHFFQPAPEQTPLTRTIEVDLRAGETN